MRGIYRFYQNGELIAEAPNLITNEGAKAILRYLANGGGNLAESIAVGIGTTTPTVTDRRLTYELERATVTVTSPDFATQLLVFKGTLPQALVANIYEIGIFTTEFSSDSRALLNFAAGIETWTGGTFTSTNTRNGTEGLSVTSTAGVTTTATASNLGLNLSSFSTVDEFLLAYNATSATGSIRIRLLAEDGTSYYQYTFTPSIGYNIKTFTKNDMTKTGTIDYGAIASVEVAVVGANTVLFDGLKIEDKDFVDPRNVLISRSLVPNGPVVKNNLSPMDIEYALDMTLT